MLISLTTLLAAVLLATPPVVEVEENVATCEPPNNGAGALWCYGAPLLVRSGDRVFASVMETGPGVSPLCNTRWRLFARDDGAQGWRIVNQADGFRHREPCPIVAPSASSLFLSTNPSTEPPGTQYGPCRPGLLRFDTARLDRPPVEVSLWKPGEGHFSDHSYRGIAADPSRGEVLVLNIDNQTSAQHWALVEADGQTVAATGSIAFPIRGCYPQVALRGRAAHVMAVGDVVEPNEAWRTVKKQKTGRAWDYVFRRLFYASSPDLARQGFASPIEIDTVDATGGHITNLDLWLDALGHAHLLYLKTTSTPIIRDHAFPGRPIVTTLEHIEIADGKIVGRHTEHSGGEGARETLHYARFHADAEGRLGIVASASGRRADGTSFQENRVLDAGDSTGSSRVLPLKAPFSSFFTANERGGSAPSNTLDLFGLANDGRTLRYARVRLR